MSELICSVDGVHYFDDGLLGDTCPCCYGRALMTETEEDRNFWKQLEEGDGWV